MGSVAGSMPVQAPVKVKSGKQTASNKLDAQAMPLDNPPVVGGGVPVLHQFGSMSKVDGPAVTVGMSMHPEELCRQPLLERDATETQISALLGKFGRLTNFEWSTTQIDGTELLSLDLGSLLLDDQPRAWNTTSVGPACVNVGILNKSHRSAQK